MSSLVGWAWADRVVAQPIDPAAATMRRRFVTSMMISVE